jgi:hypothetical protein
LFVILSAREKLARSSRAVFPIEGPVAKHISQAEFGCAPHSEIKANLLFCGYGGVAPRDTEQSAMPRVLVEEDVFTGRGHREFLDTRFGGCKALYGTAPKQLAVRLGFENI